MLIGLLVAVLVLSLGLVLSIRYLRESRGWHLIDSTPYTACVLLVGISGSTLMLGGLALWLRRKQHPRLAAVPVLLWSLLLAGTAVLTTFSLALSDVTAYAVPSPSGVHAVIIREMRGFSLSSSYEADPRVNRFFYAEQDNGFIYFHDGGTKLSVEWPSENEAVVSANNEGHRSPPGNPDGRIIVTFD